MEMFFVHLYRFFSKRRFRLFFIVSAVAAISIFLASRIRFEEDINKMISGVESSGILSRIVEQSKFLDKIIISVTADQSNGNVSPDELVSAGDRLADTLKSETFRPWVKVVTYRVADTVAQTMMDVVYNHVPLFLDQADYAVMDSMVTPERIEKAVSNDLKNLLSPASFTMKQMIVRDPVGFSGLALKKLGSFQNDENYTMVNGCIFSKDLSHLMMFITPVFASTQTSQNAVFIEKLNGAIEKIQKDHRGVQIEPFGSALIASGNAERLKKDIRLTLTITIILLSLIITFSVKKKALFPFIFLPAIFGGIMALAVLFLVQGKISVISLSIGTVIMAITVDYALHITTHYKHKHSVIQTIKDVSFPIIVCGFATAFEFLTLVFVSSESLHELGILASISVVTAAFFTMVVLPHILEATHRVSDETEEKNYLEKVLDRITNYAFDKNKLLLGAMVVYTFVAAFYFNRVGFETDMMKMNFMSDALKRTENDLNRINNAKLSSLYVVAYGSDLQDALKSNERVLALAGSLRKDGYVKSFTSPSSLLMSDSLQAVRIARWNDFWNRHNRERFLKTLNQKAVQAGFRPGSFSEFENAIHTDFKPADSSVFKTLESIFFVDNISVSPDLASIVTILKVTDEGKELAEKKFSDLQGSIVIDRKSVLTRMVNTLANDFNFIANVSLLLILLVLILAFGRIELGFITFVPILLSWIWTLGFMGIFDIRFNIFNIIISSFITGLGIDYSIYIMQGLVQGYKTNDRNLLSYKTCILISVLISISGTGVLILAKHPALNSIALISIVGLLSVVLISYTFEPLFFEYLILKKNKKRYLPVILSDLIITILVFSLFVAGCLFMNVMLVLVLLLPLRRVKKQLILHHAMMVWCRVPVYAMFHIKKKIINVAGEDFTKPALIISNHQSHIDLLLLLMLNPKLIVITTKWVWNNPIYALVIRYLNYYPVMEGYGDLTGKLRKKLDEGYSVIIFPEGSRSADSSITRFHKGAFLVAQQLELDIIPIMIHGAGDCMNKGENHLRGGSITLKIFPRIKPGEALYGSDYHEMTRFMLKYFRSEYAMLKQELETPAYFRRKLIRNYIYKGPVLEWYTRIKLSLEKNYEFINSLVPRNAAITDIGCGYGYLSYMLSFVSPDRKILAIDYDTDKVELANNCISKSENICFVAADASEYDLPHSDIFILSDVLHYLPEEKQDMLLKRCMDRLNDGGRVIIRDADRDQQKRHRATQYTEFFSTRSGFNKAEDNRLFFFSGTKIKELAEKHGFEVRTSGDSRITSNSLFVLKKQG
ncbi:MAG TPA: 1-acyl-sn-glycerol-3-phosphate acyltransferase [Bacteroidales bacterium]|nr:1-acyl-sn-glycerol-3-phosphate acyltransferase [Bacteroidales bacterium]